MYFLNIYILGMFTISLLLFIIIKSNKKQYFFMNIIYLFDFMENDIIVLWQSVN